MAIAFMKFNFHMFKQNNFEFSAPMQINITCSIDIGISKSHNIIKMKIPSKCLNLLVCRGFLELCTVESSIHTAPTDATKITHIHQ